MSMRSMMRGAGLLLIGLVAGSHALEAQTPRPRQSRPVALTGATIHTVTQGTIQNGTIVLENGKITAIGANVAIPAGAERVDVRGRHIYPGLVDGFSAMGLTEIGAVDVTNDLVEMGPFNPNVRAEVAFNPESRHIGVARSNGVVVTVTSPGGGIISGQAAAMMMEGWNWEEMTLKPQAGLIIQWPSLVSRGFGGGGGQPNEARYEQEIRSLKEAFATARAYRTAEAAIQAGQARPRPTDPRWAAMIPVLDRQVPVIVHADDVRQIQDAVAWAEEEGVRLVIRGGRDAPYVADLLARKQIPVLVTAVLDSPDREWEAYDAIYSLPAKLHAAGVPFAITGGSSAAYENRLPYEAGAAMAYGLPEDAAIRAVTIAPAQFLGFGDRVGSLEVGKDATLLVTTGNPLEYETEVERVFIEGRDVDLMDAHRRFFEKYMEKVRQMGPPNTTPIMGTVR